MLNTPKLFLKCSMLLCFVLFPLISFAQAKSLWTKPLRQCWVMKTAQMTSVPLASDNDKTLILPLSTGHLIGIDILTGKKFWKVKIQGEYSSDLSVKKDNIFLTNLKNGLQNDTSLLSITSVNSDSGISSSLFSVPVSEENIDIDNETFVTATDKTIYVSGRNGFIIAFDRQNKRILWQKNLQLELSTQALVYNSNLYFGTTNRSIVVLSGSNGDMLNQVPIGIVPTSLNVLDNTLYVGDKLGGLRAIRIGADSVLWKTKAGAEITEIIDHGKLLLISSNDNYEYAVLKSSGKKIWKRKLAGRILGKTIIDNEILVLFTHGNNVALFVDLKNGAVVNRIVIPKDQYFVSPPIFLAGKLIAPMSQGITAYSPADC